MRHVDERKADSTLCFQVFWQVKVVVRSAEIDVDKGHHVNLIEFNRDVSDHQSCLPQYLLIVVFLGVNDPVNVDLVVRRADQNFLL